MRAYDGMDPMVKVEHIWLFSFDLLIFFLHPDVAKLLLRSSEPKPKAWGEPYSLFVPWLGTNSYLSPSHTVKIRALGFTTVVSATLCHNFVPF